MIINKHPVIVLLEDAIKEFEHFDLTCRDECGARVVALTEENEKLKEQLSQHIDKEVKLLTCENCANLEVYKKNFQESFPSITALYEESEKELEKAKAFIKCLQAHRARKALEKN